MADRSSLTAPESGAVELLTPEGTSPFLLVCEHAGAEIPPGWDDLGLDPAFLSTHYAYDPGAALVTRRLSQSQNARGVLARYSRIFLDYNRFADDWDYIRPDLGGIPVPGNLSIEAEDRERREALAVLPVRAAIETARGNARAVISIHSFTPVMAGELRTIDVGLLWDEDNEFVRIALEELMRRAPQFDLRPGDNAPYDLRKVGARSLKTHAADHGLPYFYVEVNNGLFSNPETSDRAIALLDETLSAVLRRQSEWDFA
jgi:predicted N-formylglutamate amidohydrolase